MASAQAADAASAAAGGAGPAIVTPGDSAVRVYKIVVMGDGSSGKVRQKEKLTKMVVAAQFTFLNSPRPGTPVIFPQATILHISARHTKSPFYALRHYVTDHVRRSMCCSTQTSIVNRYAQESFGKQ